MVKKTKDFPKKIHGGYLYKKYKLANLADKKSDAQRYAKELRKMGYKARVTQEGKQYAIWYF